MPAQLLIGTNNQEKIAIVKVALEGLPIELLTAKKLAPNFSIKEDEKTLVHNALKKARKYFEQTSVPTLAIDSGLLIDKLEPEKQPKMFVRRILSKKLEASDVELLDHYSKELRLIGGKSKGRFQVALVLVTNSKDHFSTEYSYELLFTTKQSEKVIPGAPLSSLAIDPTFKRYLSELPREKRRDITIIRTFIEQHLDYLEQ